MLWHKAWVETRWRFLIGLAVMLCSAFGVVWAYPKLAQLLPVAASVDLGGELGRRVRESVELAREYRGYVWMQWYRQNLPQLWTLFAVLLGAGGMLSRNASRSALFTLSLPVSRNRLVGTRAAAGLAELLVLAFLPSLLIPVFSPSIGETYGVGSTLVHSACLFLTGSVFFSFAFLLSTLFSDVWRPPLIALSAALLLSLVEELLGSGMPMGVFSVMSGEQFFRSGQLPWLGLFIAMAASIGMLYAAAVNVLNQDL